jgi:hypothetical protein
MLGEDLRVAARPTAGIESPATLSRQLRKQPAQDSLRLETGESIVVSREPIE